LSLPRLSRVAEPAFPGWAAGGRLRPAGDVRQGRGSRRSDMRPRASNSACPAPGWNRIPYPEVFRPIAEWTLLGPIKYSFPAREAKDAGAATRPTKVTTDLAATAAAMRRSRTGTSSSLRKSSVAEVL